MRVFQCALCRKDIPCDGESQLYYSGLQEICSDCVKYAEEISSFCPNCNEVWKTDNKVTVGCPTCSQTDRKADNETDW